MAQAQPGWYDDGSGEERWWDGARWAGEGRSAPPAPPGRPSATSPAAGVSPDGIESSSTSPAPTDSSSAGQPYVVLQVTLKERFWDSGSVNLTELERTINAQAALGYRLHTISTSTSQTTGFGGGDRIQATMVFERLS